MDSFINLAKQGLESYEKSHSSPARHSEQSSAVQSDGQYGKTGGAEYNRRDSTPEPDIDDDEAVRHASAHAGSSGDQSLFTQALSFAKGNRSEHKQPVDEEGVINAHKAAYQEDNSSSLDAGSLGSAAALQILKQFTSGGSSGGGSQSQLVALAMGEASKLFDKSGSSSGNKQDAVNSAAITVVKLLVQSKFSGGSTGGGNSGGLGALGSLLGGGGGGSGQLLGLAAKFI